MSKQDTIRERAIKIIDSHNKNPELETIKQLDSDEYMINFHTIYHDYDEGWSCDCRYNQFKGECKHIMAIKMCKEQGIYIPLAQSYKDY